MRTTKKLMAAVLAVCMLASTSVVSGFAATTDSEPVSADIIADSAYTKACEAIESEYAYTKRDLGATYSPDSTTFKVWAPTATEVSLNLYATGSDTEEGAEDIGTCPLEKLMDGEKWTAWTKRQ